MLINDYFITPLKVLIQQLIKTQINYSHKFALFKKSLKILLLFSINKNTYILKLHLKFI